MRRNNVVHSSVALASLFVAGALKAQTAAPGFVVEPLLAGGGSGGLVGSITAIHANQNGKIYIACGTVPARLFELDPTSGDLRTVIDGLPLSFPSQILEGDGSPLLGSELVIADDNTEINQACCDGRVLRVDRATGASSVAVVSLSSQTDDPSGLAIGRGGFTAPLYVMNAQGTSTDQPRVFAIGAGGGASIFAESATLWPGTRNPITLAIDPSGAFGGDMFVADPASDFGDPGVVWRVTPAGTISQFTSSAEIRGVGTLVFGQSCEFGTDLYIGCSHPAGAFVGRVKPDASRTIFASGFPVAPRRTALAFAPDGGSLYVGIGDSVWAIRPQPGASTCCPADLDDGSATGTPDGGVDINDLLFFLIAFEAGSTSADLDNGSGNGVPDGGVDINDLLFFLTHFEAGC